MDGKLLEELESMIKGDVQNDSETLNLYSHDASLFEVKPQVVVFPKDEDDVKALVAFINKHKKKILPYRLPDALQELICQGSNQ